MTLHRLWLIDWVAFKCSLNWRMIFGNSLSPSTDGRSLVTRCSARGQVNQRTRRERPCECESEAAMKNPEINAPQEILSPRQRLCLCVSVCISTRYLTGWSRRPVSATTTTFATGTRFWAKDNRHQRPANQSAYDTPIARIVRAKNFVARSPIDRSSSSLVCRVASSVPLGVGWLIVLWTN